MGIWGGTVQFFLLMPTLVLPAPNLPAPYGTGNASTSMWAGDLGAGIVTSTTSPTLHHQRSRSHRTLLAPMSHLRVTPHTRPDIFSCRRSLAQ